MVRNLIKFLKDNKGQGAAEMVLLFGGIIVITMVALAIYSDYTKGLGDEINQTEVQSLKQNISDLKSKF